MSVETYQCPNCVAPLTFDATTQKWQCRFCGGAFTLEDIECPRPDSVPEAAPQRETPPEEEPTCFTCPTCGGSLITTQTTTATTCVFCHNPMIIADRLARERMPTHILPFHLKEPDALSAFDALCKKMPLLPKDFHNGKQKQQLKGVYVPFWLMDYEVQASIEATGRNVSHWSDADYNYTKTDTYHVERAGDMSFDNVPADGSESMDDRLMQALEPFDMEKMQPFSMAYLAGYLADTYDVDAEDVKGVIEERVKEGAIELLRRHADGYDSLAIDTRQTEMRQTGRKLALFPIWLLVTDYKGKRYQYAMNGQSGKMVGKLPLSAGRAFKYYGLITAGLTLVLTIAGRLLL